VPIAVLVGAVGLAGVTAAGGQAAEAGRAGVYTISSGPGSRSFSSRCFSVRVLVAGPGFRAPRPRSRQAFLGSLRLPFGPAKKPAGHLSLTWRGVYVPDRNDTERGSGLGTWRATGLPPRCRRGDRRTAEGDLVLTWARTAKGDVAHLRFFDFSP
jgi:hypothetical protein